MKENEKLIIKSLIKSLNSSAQVSWGRGGLEEFSSWAKKMRDVINTSTATLEAMVSDTLPVEKSESEMTAAEIIDAIERLTQIADNTKMPSIDSTVESLCQKLKTKL